MKLNLTKINSIYVFIAIIIYVNYIQLNTDLNKYSILLNMSMIIGLNLYTVFYLIKTKYKSFYIKTNKGKIKTSYLYQKRYGIRNIISLPHLALYCTLTNVSFCFLLMFYKLNLGSKSYVILIVSIIMYIMVKAILEQFKSTRELSDKLKPTYLKNLFFNDYHNTEIINELIYNFNNQDKKQFIMNVKKDKKLWYNFVLITMEYHFTLIDILRLNKQYEISYYKQSVKMELVMTENEYLHPFLNKIKMYDKVKGKKLKANLDIIYEIYLNLSKIDKNSFKDIEKSVHNLEKYQENLIKSLE